MNVGEIIKSYRLSSKLTVFEVARITGISPDSLYKIERGDTKHPRINSIVKLMAALKIPVHEFNEPALSDQGGDVV